MFPFGGRPGWSLGAVGARTRRRLMRRGSGADPAVIRLLRCNFLCRLHPVAARTLAGAKGDPRSANFRRASRLLGATRWGGAPGRESSADRPAGPEAASHRGRQCSVRLPPFAAHWPGWEGAGWRESKASLFHGLLGKAALAGAAHRLWGGEPTIAIGTRFGGNGTEQGAGSTILVGFFVIRLVAGAPTPRAIPSFRGALGGCGPTDWRPTGPQGTCRSERWWKCQPGARSASAASPVPK